VSTGPETPARFMPGRKALGFANTWGGRAGACRNSLACIFRDVELGGRPAYLQPVDLHILKHDRRRGQVITGDSECHSDSGRIFCKRGTFAGDYAMWVIPEAVAATAGVAALERLLSEELYGPRSAELSSVRGR
jgi:colicin import membrane protein